MPASKAVSIQPMLIVPPPLLVCDRDGDLLRRINGEKLPETQSSREVWMEKSASCLRSVTWSCCLKRGDRTGT